MAADFGAIANTVALAMAAALGATTKSVALACMLLTWTAAASALAIAAWKLAPSTTVGPPCQSAH